MHREIRYSLKAFLHIKKYHFLANTLCRLKAKNNKPNCKAVCKKLSAPVAEKCYRISFSSCATMECIRHFFYAPWCALVRSHILQIIRFAIPKFYTLGAIKQYRKSRKKCRIMQT